MSAGERIPSSKRFGAFVVSVVCGFSEEFDFVIGPFGFDRYFLGSSRLLRRLEFFYYGFPGAVASNDFDLLLRVGEALLAGFYQLHAFLVADDQVFEWQFTRFHLLDNFFGLLLMGKTEELSTASVGGKEGLPGSARFERAAKSILLSSDPDNPKRRVRLDAEQGTLEACAPRNKRNNTRLA
jgi:hypothetical protein